MNGLKLSSMPEHGAVEGLILKNGVSMQVVFNVQAFEISCTPRVEH